MVAPAASAASRPLLRLGHCVGSIGDMTPYTIGTERSLLQLAIPERQVTVVPLNKSCSNPDGTASGDYVDVLFLVGWGFAQQIKDAVIQPRNEARRRRKKKHTGSDDLLYYADSTMQPKHHDSSRPITIGMNIEFHRGTNPLFDIMIDSIWQGHKDGIGLYWPGMSRNAFFPGMQRPGALFQHTADELTRPVLPPKTRFCAFMVSACDLKCAVGPGPAHRVRHSSPIFARQVPQGC